MFFSFFFLVSQLLNSHPANRAVVFPVSLNVLPPKKLLSVDARIQYSYQNDRTVPGEKSEIAHRFMGEQGMLQSIRPGAEPEVIPLLSVRWCVEQAERVRSRLLDPAPVAVRLTTCK